MQPRSAPRLAPQYPSQSLPGLQEQQHHDDVGEPGHEREEKVSSRELTGRNKTPSEPFVQLPVEVGGRAIVLILAMNHDLLECSLTPELAGHAGCVHCSCNRLVYSLLLAIHSPAKERLNAANTIEARDIREEHRREERSGHGDNQRVNIHVSRVRQVLYARGFPWCASPPRPRDCRFLGSGAKGGTRPPPRRHARDRRQ